MNCILVEIQWSDGERTVAHVNADRGIFFQHVIEPGPHPVGIRVVAPNAAPVEWLPSDRDEEIFRRRLA